MGHVTAQTEGCRAATDRPSSDSQPLPSDKIATGDPSPFGNPEHPAAFIFLPDQHRLSSTIVAQWPPFDNRGTRCAGYGSKRIGRTDVRSPYIGSAAIPLALGTLLPVRDRVWIRGRTTVPGPTSSCPTDPADGLSQGRTRNSNIVYCEGNT